jgi:hypothetical protein
LNTFQTVLWQVTGNDWAQHDCAEIVSTYGEGGRLALAGFERFMEEVSEQLVQFAIPTRASLRGETRSGQESTVVMNKVVGPNHARGDGILQAGVLMKWVDLAAWEGERSHDGGRLFPFRKAIRAASSSTLRYFHTISHLANVVSTLCNAISRDLTLFNSISPR